MATYAQTTIHSKIAKVQKNNGQTIGKVVRGGTLSKFPQTAKSNKQKDPIFQNQINRQIQILPKTKTNINRKMKNKIIPSMSKGQQIVLMQSGVFPAIYFKKTSMRNVLKQFKFPENVRALPPNDDRTPLIFQIISNLFNEITFYIFNILIGENLITQSYYVFFSDSETIPFTKCCNAPVYIELMSNGSGKILCNSSTCSHSTLAQFLINFQDGKKLWRYITYFSQASQKDKQLRSKISRLIHNGKYKKMSLVDVVQDTSKQIVNLFYQTRPQKTNEEESAVQQTNQQFDDTPFLTAGNNQDRRQQKQEQLQNQQEYYQQYEPQNKPLTAQDLLQTDESDVSILKMKIHYLTRNQKNMQKKLSSGLVSNGKVFQKDFQMIKKIDEIMLKKRNPKNTTQISFPKIMEQYHIGRHRQTRGKSITVNKTFM